MNKADYLTIRSFQRFLRVRDNMVVLASKYEYDYALFYAI